MSDIKTNAYLLIGKIVWLGLALCVSNAVLAQSESQAFCARLNQINGGDMNVAGLSELGGHAKVVQQLLEVAPKEIEPDVRKLHETINGWAEALSGRESMLKAFARLSDPQLANVEGRISDYIAEHCSIRLDDGKYRADQEALPRTTCPAWTSYGSPLTANRFPNYIDISGGNYFGQNFWLRKDAPAPRGMFPVEYGGWVEFHGQYPHARYFAFHPNDEDMNNLKTLRDENLYPDLGSVNPFQQDVPATAKRYYTARFMFTQQPEHPLPNTSYVGAHKDGITPNSWVGNMIRIYASELGNGPNSGGVPLPAMTIYNAKGEVTFSAPECDPYPANGKPIIDKTVFAALPIADHRAMNPPAWSTSSNFDAPTDTWANADVQYLSTFFSHRFGELFVIRAKMPSTPNTRAGEPVSSGKTTMARLWTMCTYNFWAGIAVDCKIDHDLNKDQSGFYTLVISDASHQPSNLKNLHASWLNWGPYLDGQIVFRTLFRENPLWKQLAFAVKGGQVSESVRPYVPVGVPCTKKIFERDGWQGCFKNSGVDPFTYR